MTDFIEGAVLLFDKPYGWTSFDVVNSVRYAIQKKLKITGLKVGHAGTLDPLATGLLIVCTGRETKNIESYQAMEKEYTGTLHLGATTPTCDLESEPGNFKDISGISESQILAVAHSFLGVQPQIPPMFSAIKVNGKRAYEYARTNRDIEITPKTITISLFEITRIALPEVDFRVVCSKGTYIRALARDFGEKLGCGAYLQALRRTRIGSYIVDNAEDVLEFKEKMKSHPTVE
ncbi:MAG: tRNA pseudouridine(55) synthase TruB [Bacteroidales bacterium]